MSEDTARFADALMEISRHFAVMERDQVCCGDVSIPQCTALQRLRREVCDASTLAEYLGTSRSATTRLIDGMEKRGWLERTPDPEDGRRVLLVLSDDGEVRADELRQSTEQLVGILMSEIAEDKRADVAKALVVLGDALGRCRWRCC